VLDFRVWASLVVDRVRALVPDVVATSKGSRTVILRHGTRSATLTDEVAAGSRTWWATFRDGERSPMPGLFDEERFDSATAYNFATSIAIFFDATVRVDGRGR
jgi:hypothetical protein